MILVLVLSIFFVLVSFVSEEYTSVLQTEALIHRIYLKRQAYHRAVAVLENFVPAVLLQDDFSYDSLLDFWAKPFVLPIEEGEVSILIEDEERKININSIRTKKGYEVLSRLFRILEISSVTPEELKTWITGEGQWFKDFPPKGFPFMSLEELWELGISTDDFYGKTKGFSFVPGLSLLTTCFSNGRVNVNTAPKEVLMALSAKIDTALAERIISYRNRKPFKKLEDLIMVEGVSFEVVHDLRSVATVKSENFKVEIQLKVGEVEGELDVVFKRHKNYLKVIYWKFS